MMSKNLINYFISSLLFFGLPETLNIGYIKNTPIVKDIYKRKTLINLDKKLLEIERYNQSYEFIKSRITIPMSREENLKSYIESNKVSLANMCLNLSCSKVIFFSDVDFLMRLVGYRCQIGGQLVPGVLVRLDMYGTFFVYNSLPY